MPEDKGITMHNWKMDGGENSVMQTISIAVSVIIFAVGLINAPGLINSAKDSNATNDISNLVLAEESVLAESGKYLTGLDKGVPESLFAQSNLKVTLSGGVKNHSIVVCEKPQAFLIKATSAAGKTFYRSSFSTLTSTDITKITIPSCVAPEFYDDEPPAEIPVLPTVPEIESPRAPEGYDDTSPLITISPASASVSYTAQPNSYNVLQIKLNNVNLTNTSVDKQDWEIRIHKTSYPLNRFSSIGAISAEDSRVTCADKGNYFSCVNNQKGQYGNGISLGSSFTLGIVINATLTFVDNVGVNQSAVSGGEWYATQNVTVSTTYPVYGYWKTRVDLSALKSKGSSAKYLCINDSNVTITHDSGGWYFIEGNTNYYTIKVNSPRTFVAAKSSSANGSCVS